MSDFLAIWDSTFLEGDLSFDSNDLVTDEGLETAVIVSLFTDRRADIEDTLPDESGTDRRGWWADLVSTVEGDQIGSKLWLLGRNKTTPDILVRAKEYIEQALEWMVDDGVIASLDVTTERQQKGIETAVLAFKVQLQKNDGSIITIKFDDQWQAQFN